METVAAIPKYNLTEDQEKKLILREYRSLLRSLKPKLKLGDKELIRSAFEMAADAHKTMRRKSGEPYILHPLAVARICSEEIVSWMFFAPNTTMRAKRRGELDDGDVGSEARDQIGLFF